MKKYLVILLFTLLIGIIHTPQTIAANPDPTGRPEVAVPGSVTIELIYGGNWPAAAQTALEHATNIWEPLISSVVPIKIIAVWGTPNIEPLAETFIFSYVQSSEMPIPYAFYPEALYGAIRGDTNCPSCEAMRITFDSSLSNWYFGTDGHPSATQYDFVTVALRQIGLGLGFDHSFRYYPTNGTGEWGHEISSIYYPHIYDLFLLNQNNQQLIDTTIFPNPSVALYAQMTGGNIFFSGPLTIAANNNSPAKLYAPSTWGRSSFKFLGEYAFPTGTTNALMTPVIEPGEVLHHPGPVALAILYDMGWPLPNVTPTFNQLPNQFLQINTVRNNAINLWAYVTDDQADSQLDFEIANSPASGAGISLENNRFVDIFPDPTWVGQTTVVIRVTDPYQATATSSFVVIVANLPISLYLPNIQQP